MKHEYEYDYADIEAYIRQANQLRSQALGHMLSAGFHSVQRAARTLWAMVVHRHHTATGSRSHGLAA